MKAVLFVSFLLTSSLLFAAQKHPWQRVYTFDESLIEMNRDLVTFGGKDIGRVRFRWTFNEPQTLNGDPGTKYKSRLEVIEFNCTEKRYRPYEITYFDAAGTKIRKDEMNPPAEWRRYGSSPMMDNLYTPACELIKGKSKSALTPTLHP